MRDLTGVRMLRRNFLDGIFLVGFSVGDFLWCGNWLGLLYHVVPAIYDCGHPSGQVFAPKILPQRHQPFTHVLHFYTTLSWMIYR